MDRRRRRRLSRSESYSPPRHHVNSKRGRRRSSRSFSRSPSRSRSRSVVNRLSRYGPKRTNERFGRDRSVSPQQRPPRGTYRGRRREDTGHSSARGTSSRSRSRSIHGHAASHGRDGNRRTSSSHRRSSETRRRHQETSRDRSRTRSPSRQRRSPSRRRQSPRKHDHRRRSASSRDGSESRQRQRCASFERRRSPSQQRCGPHRSSPSSQRRQNSQRRHCSSHRRSPSPRHRISNEHRRSRSTSRRGRSRSQSVSHRRESHGACSRSSSPPRGRSCSRSNDRQVTDVLVAKHVPTVSSVPGGMPPPMKATNPAEVEQQWKELSEENGSSEKHGSFTVENDDRRDSSTRGASHGTTTHHAPSHHPVQQDAVAPASSPAQNETLATSVATPDRAVASSPRGGHSSASSPTRLTGVNDTSHTFSPAVNPNVAKRREAHRAYLKSNSDYNRARIKYLSVEADLRLAEFWLEVMTKNLEDVGKRIEVHDWNFQKITGQDESDVA